MQVKTQTENNEIEKLEDFSEKSCETRTALDSFVTQWNVIGVMHDKARNRTSGTKMELFMNTLGGHIADEILVEYTYEKAGIPLQFSHFLDDTLTHVVQICYIDVIPVRILHTLIEPECLTDTLLHRMVGPSAPINPLHSSKSSTWIISSSCTAWNEWLIVKHEKTEKLGKERWKCINTAETPVIWNGMWQRNFVSKTPSSS